MKEKKKFILLGNGSPENRGCDAITRGMYQILTEFYPDCEIINSYFAYTESRTEGAESMTEKPVVYPRRRSLKGLLFHAALKFSPYFSKLFLFAGLREEIRTASIAFSLGGDNYSLDYGTPKRFLYMGEYARRLKTPFVIYGASIGPFSADPAFEKRVAKHLRRVDLIFARERETVSYLKNIGVAENVHLTVDPAFFMVPRECSPEELGFRLPARFLALNVSDLMAGYVTGGDMQAWKERCVEILDAIVQFELPVILVPHVASDFDFMNGLLQRSRYPERFLLLPNTLNAAQYKWVISRAECNIAARTHATIASLSTDVPTISLGYSIKSKGLNRDIYGSGEYLLYREAIESAALMPLIARCLSNGPDIRRLLQQANAANRQRVADSVALLTGIIR